MDTSEMRVPLQGVAKIFEAGLKSKTWDIHGMPQFITTTHHEGCDMCKAYTLHVIEALKVSMVEIPSREVKKAFQITWPNIVCHMEDEASSVAMISFCGGLVLHHSDVVCQIVMAVAVPLNFLVRLRGCLILYMVNYVWPCNSEGLFDLPGWYFYR